MCTKRLCDLVSWREYTICYKVVTASGKSLWSELTALWYSCSNPPPLSTWSMTTSWCNTCMHVHIYYYMYMLAKCTCICVCQMSRILCRCQGRPFIKCVVKRASQTMATFWWNSQDYCWESQRIHSSSCPIHYPPSVFTAEQLACPGAFIHL